MSDHPTHAHCCGHDHDHADHQETCCCHEHDHANHQETCCCHDHVCTCADAHAPRPVSANTKAPFFGNGLEKDHGVSLGKDVEQDIAQVMKKRYQRFLSKTESFTVATEVCHQFGLVRAHLSNPERTTCVDFEVCIECEPNEIDNPMDAYQAALDGLDTIILEFFDSDRIAHFLPIWQSYELDGHTAYIRLEHSNPALDDEASAFLLAHGFTEGGLLPEEAAECDEDRSNETPQE